MGVVIDIPGDGYAPLPEKGPSFKLIEGLTRPEWRGGGGDILPRAPRDQRGSVLWPSCSCASFGHHPHRAGITAGALRGVASYLILLVLLPRLVSHVAVAGLRWCGLAECDGTTPTCMDDDVAGALEAVCFLLTAAAGLGCALAGALRRYQMRKAYAIPGSIASDVLLWSSFPQCALLHASRTLAPLHRARGGGVLPVQHQHAQPKLAPQQLLVAAPPAMDMAINVSAAL